MKRGFDRPSTSDMIATAATESTDERIRMNGLILDSTKPSLILFLSESPSYQSQSRHLDNFGPVSHPRQTLCVYNPILLACKQLVPPAKQKVPCDELEPRGERVAYISSIRTVCRSASTLSAYPLPQTLPVAPPCQRTYGRGSRWCSESPSRPQSKRGYNQLEQPRSADYASE